MKENSIKEDIQILNSFANLDEDIKLRRAIEHILLDRKEHIEKEELFKKICNTNCKRYKRLQKENEELRKKPNFYYDNNRNTYVWSCICSNTNMSLRMFLKNGEIEQYANEYYDQWCENVKEVKKVDVCEFMHNFVKPLIKEKVNSISIDTIKEKIEELELKINCQVHNDVVSEEDFYSNEAVLRFCKDLIKEKEGK